MVQGRTLHVLRRDKSQVLILLSLHYIFFGVILAFLARDAWRYNVRRIIALREDAKTQVSMCTMLYAGQHVHDVVRSCNHGAQRVQVVTACP